MIRFEHVTRHYGEADSPALEDVSIEFHRGDFVFLIGASGSGKSTLLRMILREGLPQKGKVTVAGQNLGLMLERRVPEYRRSIGMVFQDFRLLPDKSVYDNVAFAMRVIGAPRQRIRKQVMKTLSQVKLDHLAKRYPHEISGGEQQRAAIARAIVNSPAIVLADEPTGNLDPRATEEVMKILRWISASGTTVIMATHDRAIVDRMSRRVVQMHRGQLVRDEPQGSYDPPEGSAAWEILLAEEAATGLRASDPMPLRTEATAVLPAETAEELAGGVPDAERSEPEVPDPAVPESKKPDAGQRHMRVNHYRVTWPEDDDAAAGELLPGAVIDAADLPDFDQAAEEETVSLTEPAPQPERAPAAVQQREEPQVQPVVAMPSPPPIVPRSSAGPVPTAETPAQASSNPVPPPVPRPKASAAEAGYSDVQRTAEQIKSSKGGLFRRKRRT